MGRVNGLDYGYNGACTEKYHNLTFFSIVCSILLNQGKPMSFNVLNRLGMITIKFLV